MARGTGLATRANARRKKEWRRSCVLWLGFGFRGTGLHVVVRAAARFLFYDLFFRGGSPLSGGGNALGGDWGWGLRCRVPPLHALPNIGSFLDYPSWVPLPIWYDAYPESDKVFSNMPQHVWKGSRTCRVCGLYRDIQHHWNWAGTTVLIFYSHTGLPNTWSRAYIPCRVLTPVELYIQKELGRAPTISD